VIYGDLLVFLGISMVISWDLMEISGDLME
jgi:hypothetical protein